MLEPMRGSAFAFDRAVFEIEKQQYLELLQGKAERGVEEAEASEEEVSRMVSVMKSLEKKCTQSEFHSLCFCLTLPDVTCHPDYKDWTAHRGRMWCFKAVLQYVGVLFPGQDTPEQLVPPGELERLCLKSWEDAGVMEDFHNSNNNGRNSQQGQEKEMQSRLAMSQPLTRQSWDLDPSDAEQRMAAAMVRTSQSKRSMQIRNHPHQCESSTGNHKRRSKRDLALEVHNVHGDPPETEECGERVLSPRSPVAWEIKLNQTAPRQQKQKRQQQQQLHTPPRPAVDKQASAVLTKELTLTPLAAPAAVRRRKDNALVSTQEPEAAPSNASRQTYASFTRDDAVAMSAVTVLAEEMPARAVAFNPTGEMFAVGTNARALKVCCLREGASGVQAAGSVPSVPAQVLDVREHHHKGSVYCCAWDSTSRLLATGSNDKSVKVARVGSILGSDQSDQLDKDLVLLGQGGTVRDVCFSPLPESGLLVSVGAGDAVCRLWDVSQEATSPLAQLRGHLRTVYSVAFLADGASILTAGAEATIRRWDIRTGQCVCSLPTGGEEIHAIRPCPKEPDRYVVTAHADGCCTTWDLVANQALCTLVHHTDSCRTLDLAPGGGWMLTGGFDGKVAIYEAADAPSLQFVSSMRGHAGRVLKTQWHPSRPSFLTSGTDGALLYWS
ncbi:unnamed protein product [Chrysoparadoxa australica]